MLSGKQRSYLTQKSQKMKPVVYIGKNGPTDSAVKAVDDALMHHELLKVKFVDMKEFKKDIATEISEKTKAELVRVIGNIAILYKENPDLKKYRLPD